MKGRTAKLQVNDSAKPLARDQVEAELKNLEELDITKRAEGPTPSWDSPIVVAPKKTGIHMCRYEGDEIERERHPVPTVENLIVDLNGATVFSKIDLNQGYHQLELDEDSRSITTFATHTGLFHYKRLSFGINSAAETFLWYLQYKPSVSCHGLYFQQTENSLWFNFDATCHISIFLKPHQKDIDPSGRRSGLMVSKFDSGLSGPGSSPGWGHCVVFLGKTQSLTVPLSTQMYKWVPANLMLGVTLRWTSIPSWGE